MKTVFLSLVVIVAMVFSSLGFAQDSTSNLEGSSFDWDKKDPSEMGPVERWLYDLEHSIEMERKYTLPENERLEIMRGIQRELQEEKASVNALRDLVEPKYDSWTVDLRCSPLGDSIFAMLNEKRKRVSLNSEEMNFFVELDHARSGLFEVPGGVKFTKEVIEASKVGTKVLLNAKKEEKKDYYSQTEEERYKTYMEEQMKGRKLAEYLEFWCDSKGELKIEIQFGYWCNPGECMKVEYHFDSSDKWVKLPIRWSEKHSSLLGIPMGNVQGEENLASIKSKAIDEFIEGLWNAKTLIIREKEGCGWGKKVIKQTLNFDLDGSRKALSYLFCLK